MKGCESADGEIATGSLGDRRSPTSGWRERRTVSRSVGYQNLQAERPWVREGTFMKKPPRTRGIKAIFREANLGNGVNLHSFE